jgi:hypothetical protein
MVIIRKNRGRKNRGRKGYNNRGRKVAKKINKDIKNKKRNKKRNESQINKLIDYFGNLEYYKTDKFSSSDESEDENLDEISDCLCDDESCKK